jgi:hypothetical protein
MDTRSGIRLPRPPRPPRRLARRHPDDSRKLAQSLPARSQLILFLCQVSLVAWELPTALCGQARKLGRFKLGGTTVMRVLGPNSDESSIRTHD